MDHLRLRDPDHVRDHTPSRVNAGLDEAASDRLSTAARDERSLRRRLRQLDGEWNVDRALMLNLAVIGGASFLLGVRRLRRRIAPVRISLSPRARRRSRWNGWLTLFSIQLGFLAYHAVRGWCPPVAAFRRLGFRTAREIEAERHALAARLGAGMGGTWSGIEDREGDRPGS